jgi:hypothetical protein
MFHPSAATDTLQGRAIQHINETWGEDTHRGWEDYKSLGVPVCKKKYRPFEFKIRRRRVKNSSNSSSSSKSSTTTATNKNGETAGVEICVVRMYGCACHSLIRKQIILQHGERKGWERFGQWSLSKAKEAAKKETIRLNANVTMLKQLLPGLKYDTTTSSSSEDENDIDNTTSLSYITNGTKHKQQPWETLCSNGTCNWKISGKCDDIISEINEEEQCFQTKQT